MRKYFFSFFLLFLFLSVAGASVFEIATEYTYHDNIKECSSWTIPWGDVDGCATPPCLFGPTCFSSAEINDTFSYATANISTYAYDTSGSPSAFFHRLEFNLTQPETYNYIQIGTRILGGGQPDQIDVYDEANNLVGSYDPVDCEYNTEGNNSINYHNISITEQEYNQIDLNIEPCLTQYGANGYKDYIAQINLSYVNYTENEVPKANVTIERSNVCLNETGTVNLKINWSVNDVEGNEIYYDIFNNLFSASEYKEIDYMTWEYVKDYSYIQDTVTEGYCRHNELPFINYASRHNLVGEYQLPGTWSLLPETDIRLELNPECTGNSEYIYVLERLYPHLEYYTKVNFPVDDGYYTSFRFYQSDPRKNQSIDMVRNNTNLDIYINNIIHTTLTDINETIDLRVTSQPEFTTTLYNINNIGILINGTLKNIQSIGLKSNQTIQQSYFRYGNRYNISLYSSTTQPNNITFYRKGYYNIKLRITDNINKGQYYNYYNLTVKVDDCSAVSEGLGTFEDDFNIFDLADKTIGQGFKGIINTIDDGEEKLSKLTWWIFIAIILGILIPAFIIRGTLPVVTAVITSSAGCWFISYLAGNTANQISFIILFALGMVFPLSKVFGGNNE